jgi:hypothetical protein
MKKLSELARYVFKRHRLPRKDKIVLVGIKSFGIGVFCNSLINWYRTGVDLFGMNCKQRVMAVKLLRPHLGNRYRLKNQPVDISSMPISGFSQICKPLAQITSFLKLSLKLIKFKIVKPFSNFIFKKVFTLYFWFFLKHRV